MMRFYICECFQISFDSFCWWMLSVFGQELTWPILTLSHFTLLAVLRYGTNLGTALQLAQFREDAASQARAVAGLGGAVFKKYSTLVQEMQLVGWNIPIYGVWQPCFFFFNMQLINPTVSQDGGMQQTKPPLGHPSEMLRLSRSRSAKCSGIHIIIISYIYNK